MSFVRRTAVDTEQSEISFFFIKTKASTTIQFVEMVVTQLFDLFPAFSEKNHKETDVGLLFEGEKRVLFWLFLSHFYFHFALHPLSSLFRHFFYLPFFFELNRN